MFLKVIACEISFREISFCAAQSPNIIDTEFLPQGYHWRDPRGDRRTGTLGSGPSGYLELGHPLDEFDVVYGYAWDGEEPVMRDIMQRYGRADALLLLNANEFIYVP